MQYRNYVDLEIDLYLFVNITMFLMHVANTSPEWYRNRRARLSLNKTVWEMKEKFSSCVVVRYKRISSQYVSFWKRKQCLCLSTQNFCFNETLQHSFVACWHEQGIRERRQDFGVERKRKEVICKMICRF